MYAQLGLSSESDKSAASVSTVEACIVLIFDTIVVGLTFARTFKLSRDSKKNGMKNSLSSAVLRDGETIYVLSPATP